MTTTLNILDQRIDSRVERLATRTPTVPGREKTYVGSKLTQNFKDDLPIHYFNIKHGIKDRDMAHQLLDHWYIINFTPYDGFLFRDWGDYQATQQNTGLALISGSDWQLQRKHTFGGINFFRPIYKPEAGVVVYRTRSGSVSVATATVETSSGVATISGHVGGDTYSWSGNFLLPVTYKDDKWATTLEASGRILQIPDAIDLEELRL